MKCLRAQEKGSTVLLRRRGRIGDNAGMRRIFRALLHAARQGQTGAPGSEWLAGQCRCDHLMPVSFASALLAVYCICML